MIPEETARELINKFRRITDEKGLRAIKLEYAKQCALIAVEELIKVTGAKYWYDVKQEIQKL